MAKASLVQTKELTLLRVQATKSKRSEHKKCVAKKSVDLEKRLLLSFVVVVLLVGDQKIWCFTILQDLSFCCQVCVCLFGAKMVANQQKFTQMLHLSQHLFSPTIHQTFGNITAHLFQFFRNLFIIVNNGTYWATIGGRVVGLLE